MTDFLKKGSGKKEKSDCCTIENKEINETADKSDACCTDSTKDDNKVLCC